MRTMQERVEAGFAGWLGALALGGGITVFSIP